MQEASGLSTTPNAVRTISCKAWNCPAEYPSWVTRCDIKGSVSTVLNPIFWKKVQGQKHPGHPGRWGIVEHQIPSIKVLFKTNTKGHKHPSIRLLWCSQLFHCLNNDGSYCSYIKSKHQVWATCFYHFMYSFSFYKFKKEPKACDEITYQFPNFNGTTFGVWQWINYFFTHLTEHVITDPCWGES